MLDCGVASGGQLLLAETLGLAMAKRAAEILDRHRSALTAGVLDAGAPIDGNTVNEADDAEFDADNAIFTAPPLHFAVGWDNPCGATISPTTDLTNAQRRA